MTQTCVYLGPELARYGFGDEHPFGTDRMGAFQEEFERRGLDKHCQVLPPMKGDPELLALFHAPDYLHYLPSAPKAVKATWMAATRLPFVACSKLP
ncbi:hypothetical protein [Thiolapillus sp.]|uniref:hypothetical protein n=1 Tax=Thiolapillus sp. TaxID=2017437 RepID=UPI0025EAE62A|nr:hypothetical protein [Thiolapillus sp.]